MKVTGEKEYQPQEKNNKQRNIVKFAEDKSFSIMNIAELKLDLFRRLDSLDNNKLEHIYNKIISLINTDTSKKAPLSPEQKTALDEAIVASKEGRVYSHKEAMQKTKDKYPNLFR